MKKEEIVDVIKRRKLYLKEFFAQMQLDVILLGDFNNPLIVTKQNQVLSCYVHNFELIFKTAPKDGKIVFNVKLKKMGTGYKDKRQMFKFWLKTAQHREVFLFKSGDFYFKNDISFLQEKYPLFSKDIRLAYYVFSYEKALRVQKEIMKHDKNIEIIENIK